ncbi:hypothetical protein G4O51_01380 [Candidatus Bathyarchaeota archaeon A05DMB-2]|jgi:hypothetical protein|nr:hypothetical protein [Candidatus Bathyarchaeota archaeon A05DMB-2]
MKQVLTLPLFVLLIVFTTSLLIASPPATDSQTTKPFYVGVTFCGNTTDEAKLLIERVKNYTNLFVLQSGPISKNETATNEICDYAVAVGLNLIVYFGWLDPECPWQVPWLDTAKQRYSDKFLGVYYYDEPGGIQLDYNWTDYFDGIKRWNSTSYYQAHSAAIEAYLNGSSIYRNHDIAANIYQYYIVTDRGLKTLKNHSITTFTSDYALYWWDYKSGYDVILTQLGWNDTIPQDIALVRGAARMQGKPWGAIITWKYTEPPYLDSGKEVYAQMLMAYEAGAEYVVVFNYPQLEGNAYGVITDEHFEALKHFWNDVVAKRNWLKVPDLSEAQAALVLPRNYGWGMRSPDDRIWYWGPDEKSERIWNLSRTLLANYGLRLDIVYDDPLFPVAGRYREVYYWNQPV